MADDFTPREQELMAAAWQCFEEQPKVRSQVLRVKSVLTTPQIDYEKMAKLVNMSNPRSASNAWSAIKKKLAAKMAGMDGGEGGEENGNTPKVSYIARDRTTVSILS